MDRRLNLQKKLEELLGSKNVYYQPPEKVLMKYPAIRYTKTGINSIYANDKAYLKPTRYEISVIDSKPDNSVIEKLLELPMCQHDRHYIADNLHHDVFTLYY